MKPHDKELKQTVFNLLEENIGLKEISEITGLSISTMENWITEWHKNKKLTSYKRPGSAFTVKAKSISNGYYPCIRKRYFGMRWNDHLSKREFGFENPIQAIPYYLDKEGNPRKCSYCGKFPDKNKVWGLDRIDSSKGHIPGNLIPACGFHKSGMQLSCQASKSKYTLFDWLEMNMSRAKGFPVSSSDVELRISEIQKFASYLASLTY